MIIVVFWPKALVNVPGESGTPPRNEMQTLLSGSAPLGCIKYRPQSRPDVLSCRLSVCQLRWQQATTCDTLFVVVAMSPTVER